jgi:hypothetical protein
MARDSASFVSVSGVDPERLSDRYAIGRTLSQFHFLSEFGMGENLEITNVGTQKMA